MKRHKNFWEVTEDSLDKSMKIFNINKSMKNELLNLYKILSPYPEVKEVLQDLKKRNFNQAEFYLKEAKSYLKNDNFKSAILGILNQYILVFQENKIPANKKNYGNISLIAETFQRCYLNDDKTNDFFLNLINNQETDYTRYTFFYLSYLIENNNLPFRKGIALMPAKFGISFNKPSLNQGGALVHVYSDGSIRLNHGGTEMGQGLFIKVAQVVAECFKVSVDQIHITSTNTAEVPNTSATAASSGSDLNGMAAWNASNVIKNRMVDHAAKLFKKNKKDIILNDGRIVCGNKSLSFSELAFSCWENRISLSSTGYYKTPKIYWDQGKLKGHPYFYFTWGAAISEALLDINTGESRILRADIVQDCGNSLNESIDIGQIEGGFVQGLGWLTCEELCFSQEGKLLTTGPSTYKLPGSRDIPKVFNVKLLENADNEEKTIFRSKAAGEPPLLLAISHFLALKEAIKASSEGSKPELLNSPATPSEILRVLKA